MQYEQLEALLKESKKLALPTVEKIYFRSVDGDIMRILSVTFLPFSWIFTRPIDLAI